MGLAIVVGLWPTGPEVDPDELDWAREDLRQVNWLLDAHGLPPHHEPESLPDLPHRGRSVGIPYSQLHLLRRAVAFARQAPDQFGPASKQYDPAKDDRIEHEFSILMDSHLICHSDCDGFYVPIAFPAPLCDEEGEGEGEGDEDSIAGGILGSSQRALDELIDVAPLLGIPLVAGVLSDADARIIADEPETATPYGFERAVWLALYEAFRLSIEHRRIVRFG